MYIAQYIIHCIYANITKSYSNKFNTTYIIYTIGSNLILATLPYPAFSSGRISTIITLLLRDIIIRGKGWIMYEMGSKLKLGDQLKNFRTIQKIGGFIT